MEEERWAVVKGALEPALIHDWPLITRLAANTHEIAWKLFYRLNPGSYGSCKHFVNPDRVALLKNPGNKTGGEKARANGCRPPVFKVFTLMDSF